jgi:hypothetical protein
MKIGGYDREGAERIFEEHLAGKAVFLNPDGLWEWVK